MKPHQVLLGLLFCSSECLSSKHFDITGYFQNSRASPVVLHIFIGDDLVRNVIETLLSTWRADQVYYEVYRLEDSSKYVSVHSLQEALRQLPDLVQKVVYVSPNVIFMSDVKEWMERCQNVNDHVILWMDDLKCQPSMKERCQKMAEIAILNLEYLNGNVSNAFLKTNYGFIPCQLNLLTFQSLRNKADRCYRHFSEVKSSLLYVVKNDFLKELFLEDGILKVAKEAIQAIDASSPRNRLYSSFPDLIDDNPFEKFHGNVSFKSLNPELNQTTIKTANASKTPDFCENLLMEARMKRLTHIFYHYGNKIRKLDNQNSNAIEVTLLTALTLDRLAFLEMMLTHWTGPAGVLFYLTDSDASYQLPKLLRSSSILRNKNVLDRIAIHLVFKTSSFNPINYLRNVLLNNSHTSHKVYIDVDLVPNPGSYESIRKTIIENQNITNRLFIIPAFQAFEVLWTDYPKDKNSLLDKMDKKTVTGYGVNDKNSNGHRATNYTRWTNESEPYEAIYTRNFEPYVVVPKSLQERFIEDLLERMQDKIAYVRTLKAMNYKFFVLPNDYVIHLPHPPSQGKKIFMSDRRFTRCDSVVNERLRKVLMKRYPKAKI